MLEGIADRLGGHRLHPKALDGLLHARFLDDVAENQLAFTPGVAGIDDGIHVRPLEQPLEHFQAGLGFLDRLQIKFLRQYRQVIELPLKLLSIRRGRHRQLQKVADGAGNDMGVVFEILLLVFELRHARLLSQHTCQVCHDGGFFCDNQGLGHGGGGI